MGENWSVDGFSGQTVRQEVRVSGGGTMARIRLSNLDGTEPLRIAEATIAESAGGAGTEPGTMRSLTFRGSRSVTIPAGQVTASDATGLHVAPLESLTVTLYFATATGPSTFHEDGLTTTYQASGDHVRDRGASAFDGPTSHSYYYLTGVDVATRGPQTVVAFGDSITNGGQYDAVADFAAAVADPADPRQLNPSYDSGDHFHPNDAGYRAIAAAINIGNL